MLNHFLSEESKDRFLIMHIVKHFIVNYFVSIRAFVCHEGERSVPIHFLCGVPYMVTSYPCDKDPIPITAACVFAWRCNFLNVGEGFIPSLRHQHETRQVRNN